MIALVARVRDDSPLTPIRCAGEEYIRTEWRPVPAGREAEAAANPYLAVDDRAAYDLYVASPKAPAAAEPEPEILTAEQSAAAIKAAVTPDEIAAAEAVLAEPALGGAVTPDDVAPAAAEPVTIDRSDGISAPEASAAGQALAQRAHEKAAAAAQPEPAPTKRAAKAAGKKAKG